MKDILLGGIDNLNWQQIKPWVLSAKEVGFSGDIWLICYRVDADTLAKLEEHGVQTYCVEHDPYGQPIQHYANGSPTQSHNLRFYHAWELLTRLTQDGEEYNFAIMTDVRDVVFQRNPQDWLGSHLYYDHAMVAPGECIDFGKEPWNEANLRMGYGDIFYDLSGYNAAPAYNVGTIAGDAVFMKYLFHTLYSMTEGRGYPSDQSSFNVLVNGILHGHVLHDSVGALGWAAQLGTTNDPTKEFLWERAKNRPVIRSDNIVTTQLGEPYVLVHQWDRVPQLKQFITAKYS